MRASALSRDTSSCASGKRVKGNPMQCGNLLIPRMDVTAYNPHARLLSSEPWSLAQPSLLGRKEPTPSWNHRGRQPQKKGKTQMAAEARRQAHC